MKTKNYVAVILLLIVTNVMSLTAWHGAVQKKALLENYYAGAEELLDTLENHYNWIDAIDNDAYYSAVGELSNH